MEDFTILLLLSSLLSIPKISISVDTISPIHFLTDGDTIISSGGNFEMGFFGPGNSTNRYVGIWYNKISIKTVVWVANREIPIGNKSGLLKIVDPGVMVLTLLNNTNNIIWSSNKSISAKNPIAQLLDSGNLVIREENDDNPENYIWESFDYPGDTQLPGMKVGKNFITGRETYLSSWKSEDDPAPGDFTYRLDPTGYPRIILKKGLVVQCQTGPWNGLRFSGRPSLSTNSIYTRKLVFNKKEVYYTFELISNSVLTRLTLNQSGIAQRWTTWVDQNRRQGWLLYLTVPTDSCDAYSLCGENGSCDIQKVPICACLDKFVPKLLEDWNRTDWSNGCVRRTPLDCNGDGFLRYSPVKLPDTPYSWFNESMSLEECRNVCLKKCNCTAYANLDIRNGGSGCLLWFGDLIDMRKFPEGGQDIYIRMAASELAKVNSGRKKKVRYIVISILLTGIFLLGLSVTLCMWRKKKEQLKRKGEMEQSPERSDTTESQNDNLELPLFDYATIANATDNFSSNNKLGEGGFGPVYKGMLNDGQDVAVKKLSRNSIQGPQEFKNEALCIAKLQHRNLVKLLGCCVQLEKMLIYEYMPNKSLDFIFDQTQSRVLDWPKRINIINGIARGLLYLHQDSRLRIIHRDLKASNILLDNEMNPKISDFGMARIFRGNETEATTTRVVGTYGYMAPEYAIDGLFSVKSDVFSFGVLVLEIVSGKRNRHFYHKEHCHNLLGHAWKFFNEGRSIELIDMSVQKSHNLSEVMRSIHVGLLCVQQSPEDRPSMSTVVLMLTSEHELPIPKQPGFFSERNIFDVDSLAYDSATANEITVTLLAPR